ncbi:MAG: hypothetical protein RSG92_15350 [Pseudomonas sp.]
MAQADQDILTKRELIAAMAMQGLASVAYDGAALSPTDLVRLDVSRAVMYADALLAELAKEPQA